MLPVSLFSLTASRIETVLISKCSFNDGRLVAKGKLSVIRASHIGVQAEGPGGES